MPTLIGAELLAMAVMRLPALFALAGAETDEREVLPGMLEAGRDVADGHRGQRVIGDENYSGRRFGADPDRA